MDVFKEYMLLLVDDLKEKVENSYLDKDGICEVVDEVLMKFYKKKEEVVVDVKVLYVLYKIYVVIVKELIDEVVKQEIVNYIDFSIVIFDVMKDVVDNDELKRKLY